MAEVTSVTQVFQVGAEVTAGTAVAANRSLPSVQFTPGIDGSFNEITANGYKFAVLEVPGKEWSTGKFTAQPTYDEIVYLLQACLMKPTPAQQAATTAYLWAFAPSTQTADVIQSLTVEHGSATRARKFPYGVVTDFTLKGDRDKVEFSGNMIGQLMQDGISLTGSPTAIAQVPILPKEFSVFLDPTFGAIGTTRLARVLSWELNIKNKYAPLWVVDSTQTSWVGAIETPISGSFKMMVEADVAGSGILTNMRAGSTSYVRLNATSAQLAGTAIPYSLTADLMCQVSDAPKDFADSNGVYAINWSFGLVHDAGAAKAMSLNVINKRTAF